MALAERNHGPPCPPGSPDPFLQSCFPATWIQPVLLLGVIPFQGQDLVFASECPELPSGCFSSPSWSLWIAALPSGTSAAPRYLLSAENEPSVYPVLNLFTYPQFGHKDATGDSVKGLAKVKIYSSHSSASIHSSILKPIISPWKVTWSIGHDLHPVNPCWHFPMTFLSLMGGKSIREDLLRPLLQAS